MTETAEKAGLNGITSKLPLDRLKDEARSFGEAMTKQGLTKASGHVESMTSRLNDFADGKSTATKMAANVAQGDSPAKAGVKAAASKVKDTVKDKLGFGGGGKGKIKVTNILESVDVPVSREVAYAQWTQFEDFPTFMKKVENVDQQEDEKLKWRAQIFWSHRSWTAEIVDQVPNERVVWKSDGDKGSVDGAVTFHELAPELTRIQMVLEYHPKGLFEHTGNLWRAQGRRARLELKHFARHVSTQTILHQEELDGWKGEIRDGEVTDGDTGSKGEESEDRPARRRTRKAPARKTAAKKTAAKTATKKTSATRSTAKKTAAKKTAANRSTANRSTANRSTASKSAAKKAPAKKAAAKEAPAKKTPAKKTAASRTAAKRTTATRSTAKKTSAGRRSAKKSSSKAGAR